MGRRKKDPIELEIKKAKKEMAKEYDAKKIFYDNWVIRLYKQEKSPKQIADSLKKPEAWAIARIKELKLDESK